MTEQGRQQYERNLYVLYQQLHLTVVYEQNFLENLGSQRSIIRYRDSILDRINDNRRVLGYI
jgi:hypothetical protein